MFPVEVKAGVVEVELAGLLDRKYPKDGDHTQRSPSGSFLHVSPQSFAIYIRLHEDRVHSGTAPTNRVAKTLVPRPYSYLAECLRLAWRPGAASRR